jgi:hypothetical protein
LAEENDFQDSVRKALRVVSGLYWIAIQKKLKYENRSWVIGSATASQEKDCIAAH